MRKFTLFTASLFAAMGVMAQTYQYQTTQLTSTDLNDRTEETLIVIKNLTGTNDGYYVGTEYKSGSGVVHSQENITEEAVFVWEPVENEKTFYIRNFEGKYMQTSSPADFGDKGTAAKFYTTNPTSTGSGETQFNGDSNASSYIDGNNDPKLVRFVVNGTSTWINVKGANAPDKKPAYNDGKGGWTIHYVYETVREQILAGEGTEANPYLIRNVGDLVFFRNSVNEGVANKYNAPGVWVALAADIDLADENWVGIGSATAEHGFMGNFDGKTFKIKNLTITNPALDADGYAYAGLFSVTEGADQDKQNIIQNIIKNLTIENVTISTTGHLVSAAIAYPYYTIVENVNVCGNISIKGGDYTAGVLAYTRRCVNASNLTVAGEAGSSIEGHNTVGGVISDIQMNDGLKAEYADFSASGLTITGNKAVGGISGIIAGQTLNGCSVENVTLVANSQVGVVAGSLGAASTITGEVVTSNVEGATTLIGAGYNTGAAVEAKIGDTYYSTLAEAVMGAGDVELLTDVTLKEDVAYASTSSKQVSGTITYTRNLTAYWNPIYLPFAVELSTEDYDVAVFTSAEGETLTLTKIEGETATLAANTAYAIRPKTEEAKTLTITLEDATLEAATVVAQDLGNGFSVKGNYSVLTGDKLGANDRVVGTNGNWGVLKSTSTLKPFRLILTIPAGAQAISMRVEGEGVTSIENLDITIEGNVIYDLMGRRVETMTEGGIYIVNGKKVVL